MALQSGEQANFQTLINAAKRNDLFLAEMYSRTGQRVAVICAANRHENADIEMVPLAKQFAGNPYSEMAQDPMNPPRPCPTTDTEEVELLLANGWKLVSGCYNPDPTSCTCGEYVRLVDELGAEVCYWDSEEWGTDPVLVMGAIINAAAKQLRIET